MNKHNKQIKLESSLGYYKDLHKRWSEAKTINAKERRKRVNRCKVKVQKIEEQIRLLGD